jgi:hypothetical protein
MKRRELFKKNIHFLLYIEISLVYQHSFKKKVINEISKVLP